MVSLWMGTRKHLKSEELKQIQVFDVYFLLFDKLLLFIKYLLFLHEIVWREIRVFNWKSFRYAMLSIDE